MSCNRVFAIADLHFGYFAKIYGAVEYRGCILTHIPVNPNQFPRYRANIHGHLHHHRIDDPRYICVSAEQANMTPVLFDRLIQRVTEYT